MCHFVNNAIKSQGRHAYCGPFNGIKPGAHEENINPFFMNLLADRIDISEKGKLGLFKMSLQLGFKLSSFARWLAKRASDLPKT